MVSGIRHWIQDVLDPIDSVCPRPEAVAALELRRGRRGRAREITRPVEPLLACAAALVSRATLGPRGSGSTQGPHVSGPVGSHAGIVEGRDQGPTDVGTVCATPIPWLWRCRAAVVEVTRYPLSPVHLLATAKCRPPRRPAPMQHLYRTDGPLVASARRGWTADGHSGPLGAFRSPALPPLTCEIFTQPQRGSNPCLHLERVVS